MRTNVRVKITRVVIGPDQPSAAGNGERCCLCICKPAGKQGVKGMLRLWLLWLYCMPVMDTPEDRTAKAANATYAGIAL